MKYAINGFLFSQRQTGVMRLAREILLRIDKMDIATEMCLVVPVYADKTPPFERIKIIRYGKLKSNLWEQISFSRYANKNGLISINFNNTKPIFSKGMMFIHDLAYVVHPEYASSFHGKVSNVYHRFLFWLASKTDTPIFTISNYSKQQIIEHYKIKPDRIGMVRCGWEHMQAIESNPDVLARLGLNKGGYYFTLGSLSKMKNTSWVLNVAKRNPDSVFVITGGQSFSDGSKYDKPDNVILTGFISDGEIKSLMQGCRAFLYPSLYEGFGIPPLEALSLGASVVCSSSPPLPEIYKGSVGYIDPYKFDIDLDEVVETAVSGRDLVLNAFKWDSASEDFLEALNYFFG